MRVKRIARISTVLAMIEKSNAAQLIAPSGTAPALPLVGPVEIGIPIPRRKSGGDGALIRRLRSLAIGNSFETGCSRVSVYEGAKKLGITVTVRARGRGRIGVWRLT
jgi:hypothetical protein